MRLCLSWCDVCNHCQIQSSDRYREMVFDFYWKVKGLEQRLLRIFTQGRRATARGMTRAATEYEYGESFLLSHISENIQYSLGNIVYWQRRDDREMEKHKQCSYETCVYSGKYPPLGKYPQHPLGRLMIISTLLISRVLTGPPINKRGATAIVDMIATVAMWSSSTNT